MNPGLTVASFLCVDSLLKFLVRAAAERPLPYATFIQHALYHPELGYYTNRGRHRVGHDAGADFYTAESLGPVFARLAVAAAHRRATSAGIDIAELVECGAEAGAGITPHASPPFAAARAIHVGESIALEAPCVVFCNELLDAQPFHRLLCTGTDWVELGVGVEAGQLVEVQLDVPTPEVAPLLPTLPIPHAQGYRIDLPLGAEALLRHMATQPGVRCIVAFDYGLDWGDLLHRRPAGTARTYHRQQLGTDLLARPGGQDITCHVCWDRLEAVLREAGYQDVRMERQEAFLVRNAAPELTLLMQQGTMEERATVRELLHPTRMGSAFQVLSATR